MGWLVAALVTLGSVSDGGVLSEQPQQFHEPMTRPSPITPIDWSYPEEARANNPSGTIILKCIISEEGAIEGCEVLRSLPGVTEWAIEKLHATRFRPAAIGGKPIRVSYVFNIMLHPSNVPKPQIERARWRPPPSPELARNCVAVNAPVCRDVALSFLHPDGGQPDFESAGRLLTAACDGGLEDACSFLDAAFLPPRLLSGVPSREVSRGPGGEGTVVCRITIEGRARECHGPGGPLSDWFVARMLEARFLPATFEGKPFETEHWIHYSIRGRR